MNLGIKRKRQEAEICFQDWCAKVYDENAELLNWLATVAGFIAIISAITKTQKG